MVIYFRNESDNDRNEISHFVSIKNFNSRFWSEMTTNVSKFVFIVSKCILEYSR